jgi:hypothetical protein
MSFSELLEEINAIVKTNGAKEINGNNLNQVLTDIVNTLRDHLPSLYSEDKSSEEATIAASQFRVTSEGFIVTTSNSTLIFDEEEGFLIRYGAKDLLKVSPTILEANIGRLHFEMSGGTFTFSINDGSSDYVITFDESNGIVMADVNIQATLEDLQRQIDELKNNA